MKRLARAIFGMLAAAPAALAYEPAGTPADWPAPMGVPMAFGKVLADRLEAGFGDDADNYAWDVQAWYGLDFDRLWLKTEGEGEQWSGPGHAEVQLLYSRLFTPFWDWQLGLRYDLEPAGRAHLAFGVQGIVPYELEWDSALFLSENGDLSARLELEYDLRLTRRLIVQPRFELNVSAADAPESGLGSGLNDTQLGLRLRYEFRREFAPYLGVSWQKLYGDTADIARGNGETDNAVQWLIGVRAWF